MPKFKLLAGGHIETTPNERDPRATTRFKPGDVFESDAPLDKMFSNKFERVGEDTQAFSDDYDPTFDKDDVMDKPLHMRKEAKKAELAKQPDRTQRSSSKFQVKEPGKPTTIKMTTPVPVDDEETADADEEGEEEDNDTPSAEVGGEDEDVSASFPDADKGGFKVMRGGDGYNVLGDDDSPLHKKRFTKKSEVHAFLKKTKASKK